MPSRKDEQFDDVADTATTRRRRAWETSPQAQLPRNLPQREEDSHGDFYSAEHPEVPKIRRASLYRDPDSSSSRHPATRASGIETEPTRSLPPLQRKAKPYAGLHEYDEQQPRYTEPRSKIVASPRRPRSQVSPPSTQPSRVSGPPYTSQLRNGRRRPAQPQSQRHGRQVLAPLPFLSPLLQRQKLLIIFGYTVVFLLIFAVVSSLLHNFFAQIPAVIILPGGANNTSTDSSNHPPPPVLAQAAYLLDADTGNTLYAYNPSAHLPIMSTTKLMTALLAVEHGNLDQNVTLNDQIANDINQLPPDSSNVGLKAGESYTLRQLMYGLLLVSGNDAAIAIADTIGGSYANFIAMMNQKAAALGLHDTHFENPHGLQQPNHYSSSHDLAIIGLNSLSNSTVRQISGTLRYHIDQTPQHPAHDLFNGNQFIWWYPGADAGKPGYDAATNFVQVISCVRNNHHLIGVTIHTIDWWTDMRDLMNWGFNTYTWVSPHDLNTAAHPIPYADLWGNFNRDKKENTIPTADHGRYYIYTGYSITGDIENYFDKNGGLATFGFPLSQAGKVGDNTLSQRFEHGTIQCDTQSKQCQRGQ